MAATPQAVRGTASIRLRRIGWRHPEWWVVLVAAAAWAFMVATSFQYTTHAHAVSGASQGIVATAVMVAAMMLPLTIPNVRHVALSSLWRRRHRAMAAFLVGFLCVWVAVQTVIQGTLGFLTPSLGWTLVAGLATVTAVLWGVSPGRKRRLRRCGLTVPLAPRGWRADADCARYGVITGLSCVTTCWALMAAIAAFSHSILFMTAVFSVQLSDRYRRRPPPGLTSLVLIGIYLLSLAMRSNHH